MVRELRVSVVAVAMGLLIGAPTLLHARGHGTPDSQPPAWESPCDDAGLRGAAYGLCIAYCEANDCEIQPEKYACAVLRANYLRYTGDDVLPCEYEEHHGE